jgi:hypothetical protein
LFYIYYRRWRFHIDRSANITKKAFIAGVTGFALQTEVWIADIQEKLYGNEFFLFWHKTILNLFKTVHVPQAWRKSDQSLKTEQR